MSTPARIRPITATEVARKLMDRPSAAESVTLKRNAKGEVQPEVTAVRAGSESLMDCAKRAEAVLNYLDGIFMLGNGSTPFDD